MDLQVDRTLSKSVSGHSPSRPTKEMKKKNLTLKEKTLAVEATCSSTRIDSDRVRTPKEKTPLLGKTPKDVTTGEEARSGTPGGPSGSRNGPGYKKSGYSSQKKKIMIGDGKYLNLGTTFGKVKYAIIKWQSVVQGVLALEIACILSCLLALLICVILHHTKSDAPYRLAPPPPAVDFEEFSVVSSNEFCNELARMFLQEEQVVFFGVYFLMDLCLSLTEPQAGGWGGDSVALYVDMRKQKCWQMSGERPEQLTRESEYFKGFIKELKRNPDAGHFGPWSSQFPRHVFTFLGAYNLMLNQTMQNGTEEEIHKAFKKEMTKFLDTYVWEEILPLNIPMSRRLDAAHSVTMASMMLTFQTMPVLIGDHNRQLEEGQLFELPLGNHNPYNSTRIRSEEKVRKMLANYIANSLTSSLKMSGTMSVTAFRKAEIEKNLHITMQDKANTFFREIDMDKKTLGNGMKMCTPEVEKNDKSLIQAMLEKYSANRVKETETTAYETFEQLVSKEGESIFGQIARDFFSLQQNFISSAWKAMARANKQAVNKTAVELEAVYAEEGSQAVVRKKPPYAGNFFAVVNHRTKEAIVAGSSLGTEFGSGMGTYASVLNNFNVEMLKGAPRTAAFYGAMEPAIVVEQDRIHSVYAGTAGHSSVSLDLPRKMTTLALSLFHNVSVEKAFTAPLVYTDDGSDLRIKGDIPYFVVTKIRETLTNRSKETKRPPREDLSDEAGVVSGRRAVQFMARKELGIIMPNGY